jgi:RNA-directed DNA polymerase
MIKNIPIDKEILKKWLKAGYVEQGKLFPTERNASRREYFTNACNIDIRWFRKGIKEKVSF